MGQWGQLVFRHALGVPGAQLGNALFIHGHAQVLELARRQHTAPQLRFVLDEPARPIRQMLAETGPLAGDRPAYRNEMVLK